MHLRKLIPLLGICLAALRAHGALSPINNIDILEPIVRSSPALSQSDNDYFGWSAILHQIREPNVNDDLNEAVDKTRIIIGAPLGTFPGGLNLTDPFLPREKQTGLVYSCPIAPGQCDGVQGDTSVYLSNETIADNDGEPLETRNNLPQSFVEGRLFDQAPNARLVLTSLEYGVSENKSGQLLGSTLFSSGDRFIACAPRWTDDRESILDAEPRGVCYYSGRNLSGFQRLRPCNNPNANEEYCLAGKSAIEFMGYFILGAPGFSEGRGALYYSSSENPATFTRGNSEQRPPETDIRDQYQGFVTIPAYITRARSSGNPNIVTTVPRYDDDTYRGRINVYNPSDFMNLVTTVVAEGSQMGEFFGYSMIAVDINGDGYDDLVIGAPMNTDYTNLLIERGRIYIFINSGSGTLMPPIIVNGGAARGRFGTSLVNLGDINNDSYEDFAVGAPYENGTNSNTGAVYIYYGTTDPSSLSSRQAFKISADNILARVSASGLNRLRTFGWSLSSVIDVDNNGYRDLVVGAYESQTVFLLRTLPVATVTVDIMPVPEVDLTSNFMVTVTASYTGRGVEGTIRIPFVLSEVLNSSSAPRLSFANGGNGTFVLSGPGQIGTQMVSVTPLINTTSLDPYTLRLELEDVMRPPRANFDGNQSIVPLTAFPRLVQAGTPTEQVSIRNPCGNDGCESDVRLHPPTRNITVISGGATYHDIDLFYQHVSGEDAVGLNLILTNIPTAFISGVTIVRQGSSPSETPCSSINSTGFATCNLQPRLQPGNSGMISVNFTVNQTALIGMDPTFSVGVEIVLQTEDIRDVDLDTDNNAQQIGFNVDTRADISVEQLSFGGASFNYTAMTLTQRPTSTVSLGQSVTLRVDIRNSGPSIIGDGSVNISLPYKIMASSQFTLLYPTRIQGENSANGLIQCNGIVDPDNLDGGSPQTSESRRKRMAEGYRSRHNISPSSLKRVARQMDEPQSVNCAGPDADPTMCAMISCRIKNLKKGLFTVSIFTRIDQRFFGNQATVYRLTAYASVSVNENLYGDRPENNSGQVVVTLMPMPAETAGETGSDIIHYILWPCIGGIVLLILAAVLLYFVGFFRRKRKPEEGEIEGDFDVDQYKLKPAGAEGEEVVPPEASEVSAPPQKNSEEITKV